MRPIVTTLTEPADHLALDEALLLLADESGLAMESIRIWQFASPVVVLGRSSKIDVEVDCEFCCREKIPVMRRCSGGAAVVGGPGCLIYSVVLSHESVPELKKVDAAHAYVMQRVAGAIAKQLPDVQRQGICDVTWQNRKCSGNSLRIAKHHLLYHGTILYAADLRLLARCLREAPRQPDYRRQREHGDFVTNIPVDPIALTADLLREFGAQGKATLHLPRDRMDELRRTRYDVPAWHRRH